MGNELIKEIKTSDIFRILKKPSRKWRGIIIHHSGDIAEEKVNDARNIASFHINYNKWQDLGYHFVIEDDGTIYISNNSENARWIYQRSGAHCNETYSIDRKINFEPLTANSYCIGICLTGNFEIQNPMPSQTLSLYLLCFELIKGLPLDEDNIWEHKYFAKTDCPGQNFNLMRLKQQLKLGLVEIINPDTIQGIRG